MNRLSGDTLDLLDGLPTIDHLSHQLARSVPALADSDDRSIDNGGSYRLIKLSQLPLVFNDVEANMLVLSRHRDESIMIGDDVVVTIVDIRGDKVRLGIEAPQSIPVHRQEVYDAIQRENRRSSQTSAAATKDVKPPRD